MDTKIKGFGPSSEEIMQVDPTYDAARTSLRPIEYVPDVNGPIGGHFSIGTQTGLMAAGIASLAQVFQVRWADPAKLFLLKRLTVQFSTCTGFAATALGAPVELIIGHGTTANGSSGTALAPTNSNQMRRTMGQTSFATSGELRIATTAALTAATGQTLEAAPLASCMGADNRTLVSTPPFDLFRQQDAGDHPCVLYAGDTLVLRTNSPAATGTWTMSVLMNWVETVAY